MPNKVTITFVECDPPPANDYILKIRVAGSGNDFIVLTGITFSPIEIIIFDDEPLCTDYEGTIQADCGNNLFGQESAWTTEGVACFENVCRFIQNISSDQSIGDIQWVDCGGFVRDPLILAPSIGNCFNQYISDNGLGTPENQGDCVQGIFSIRNALGHVVIKKISQPQYSFDPQLIFAVPLKAEFTNGLWLAGRNEIVTASISFIIDFAAGSFCGLVAKLFLNGELVSEPVVDLGESGTDIELTISSSILLAPGDNLFLEFSQTCTA